MPAIIVRKLGIAIAFIILLATLDKVHTDNNDDEALEHAPGIEPDGVHTLKFNPADMTDEDQHSQHMPTNLRCDGCRVIAYLLKTKFQKMTEKFKKSKDKITESEILDMVETVCTDKDDKYQEYGVKEVKGKKRLSGPGLETKDVPGIMQGGGKWPNRFVQMCHEFTGELGEEEIYAAWQEGHSLEDFLCRNKEIGVICKDTKVVSKTKKEL